jgi:amino acid transporter
MLDRIARALIGNPLPSSEEVHRRLSKIQALAIFSSDALSSVAYAPEEIMLVLVIGGTTMLQFSFPIALCITILLAIVATSYYQTIHGYPSGGGAYIVAYDNLGTWSGLIAAAALLIDYVLTVAVSITAGVAAITSAFVQLQPHTIPIALLAILLIVWGNLRGIRESGTLFSIPSYAFIGLTLALIITGLTRLITGSLSNAAMPAVTDSAQPLAILLILRAFASGTTALTGVEAISNGVMAFKKPEAENAGKTLIAMAFLLAVMFIGIVFLTNHLGIVPGEHETIVSKLGRTVFGSGLLYLLFQSATAMILFLAANTSFAGFPRLAAILAKDRFLPRQLANVGDRLVFSNGILALAILAAALVVGFGGNPHRLIPLYAVGVFLSFTLSQTGMVRLWLHRRGKGWIWKAFVNGLGALTTGAVLLVITSTKFLLGAWVVVVLIPILVGILYAIKQHYLRLAEQLTLKDMKPKKWDKLARTNRHKVIVPLSGLHRGSLEALRFARSLSKDVTAVVVEIDPEDTARIKELWPRWGSDVKLKVLDSPYRSTIQPLLSCLDDIDRSEPERGLAVVVLPEFIPAKWWHTLLHNQTAKLIKRVLLYRRGLASTDRVLIDVPYHLHH